MDMGYIESGSVSGDHRRLVAFAVGGRALPGDRPLPRVIAGAIAYGQKCGWRMLDLSTWSYSVPDFMRPDGVIIYLGYDQSECAQRLHRSVPASVFLDTSFEFETVTGVTVRHHYANGGERCAQYMLRRGFRNFVVCCYDDAEWNPAVTAFEDRVMADGAVCARITSLSAPLQKLDEKRLHFRRELSKLQLPLAIFCLNDRLSARVCGWCLDMGLEIPEQVTILGMGNDLLHCECSPVPLSSLDWQPEHRGAEGARMLERMMNGEPVPKQTVLVPPGEVVTRRSTDILAVPDLASARALRYIWDHYRESIGPADIAAACGLSRRTLDRHFSSMLGHTVNRELTRYRLIKACELLAATPITVSDIAALCGFSTPQYFTLRFKHAFGKTPVRYREQERVVPRATEETKESL